MKKLIPLFQKEDFPNQACSSSGFPSQLQLKLFAQTQNQTGSYSAGYLPVVVTIEATSRAIIDNEIQVGQKQNTIQIETKKPEKNTTP